MVPVLKTGVGKTTGGSNPSLSARCLMKTACPKCFNQIEGKFQCDVADLLDPEGGIFWYSFNCHQCNVNWTVNDEEETKETMIYFCKGCNKKIDPTYVKEKRANNTDIFNLSNDVLSFEESLTISNGYGPYVKKIKWKYHTEMYNINGNVPGMYNFCAGYRDCGPIVEKLDINAELDDIMD